jgi:DnaJ family protein A protein 2
MANVADTKLYDILGVPPGASENELKKVLERAGRRAGRGRGACAVWAA